MLLLFVDTDTVKSYFCYCCCWGCCSRSVARFVVFFVILRVTWMDRLNSRRPRTNKKRESTETYKRDRMREMKEMRVILIPWERETSSVGISEWSDRATKVESSVTWSRLTFLLLLFVCLYFCEQEEQHITTKQKQTRDDKPVCSESVRLSNSLFYCDRCDRGWGEGKQGTRSWLFSSAAHDDPSCFLFSATVAALSNTISSWPQRGWKRKVKGMF